MKPVMQEVTQEGKNDDSCKGVLPTLSRVFEKNIEVMM
jgi:hypothetical protein